MSLAAKILPRMPERVKTELQKRYFGNSVDYVVNIEGDRRIREAQRHARGQKFDPELRAEYQRGWCSRLDGHAFEPSLFESIRSRAVAALSDPKLSPCCFNSGNQAELQGIPRDLINKDYRRGTTDVRSIIPDAPKLLNPPLIQAIRSCIGSNFFFEAAFLKRNYHVEPDLQNQYDLLSDRWHFDHQYPDGFSLFVNLGDFTAAEGPTEWVNRPDSLWMLRKGFNADERIRSRSGGLPDGTIERCPSYDRLIGPAGSMALIHTSYCLHRSGVPGVGLFRDTMCFTFRPSTDMNTDWPAS